MTRERTSSEVNKKGLVEDLSDNILKTSNKRQVGHDEIPE